MKNVWLQRLKKKSYQVAYFRNGEWWHSVGVGTDINEAKRLFNIFYSADPRKRRRLIEHPYRHNSKDNHVDEGKVIMEK